MSMSDLNKLQQYIKTLNDPSGLNTLRAQIGLLNDQSTVKTLRAQLGFLNDQSGVKALRAQIGLLNSQSGIKTLRAQIGLLNSQSGIKTLRAQLGFLNDQSGVKTLRAQLGFLNDQSGVKTLRAQIGLLNSQSGIKTLRAQIGLLNDQSGVKTLRAQIGLLNDQSSVKNLRAQLGLLNDISIHRASNQFNSTFINIENFIELTESDIANNTLTLYKLKFHVNELYTSLSSFLNERKIPKYVAQFIVIIVIPLLLEYLTDSTEQIITAIQTESKQIQEQNERNYQEILDSIQAINDLAYKKDEYITIRNVRIYPSATNKHFVVIPEGTYVYKTHYQLGRRLYVNYSTENHPDPLGGWIDKKYIVLVKPELRKREKLIQLKMK